MTVDFQGIPVSEMPPKRIAQKPADEISQDISYHCSGLMRDVSGLHSFCDHLSDMGEHFKLLEPFRISLCALEARLNELENLSCELSGRL